jgi:hypothetical protein
LGERLLCKQEVIGSIPFTSTTAAAAALTFGEARETVPGRPGGRGWLKGEERVVM